MDGSGGAGALGGDEPAFTTGFGRIQRGYRKAAGERWGGKKRGGSTPFRSCLVGILRLRLGVLIRYGRGALIDSALGEAGQARVFEHECFGSDMAEPDADAGIGAPDDGFNDALAELWVAHARINGKRPCGFGSTRAAEGFGLGACAGPFRLVVGV